MRQVFFTQIASSYLISFRFATAASSNLNFGVLRPFQSTALKPVVQRANALFSQLFQLKGGDSYTSNRSKSSDQHYMMDEGATITMPGLRAVWSDDDKVAFAALDHVGYTIESDTVTHTGGWSAHKAVYVPDENDAIRPCWIKESVEGKITQFDYSTLPIGRGPRILILYGSLRPESFSRKCAFEFARILDLLGCDVRIYNPRGLPVRDPSLENDIKVVELRALSMWSEGHVWVSPEMHGTITGVFKNQIDWIPLNTGSVRPTQGRTCQVAQVNGGSQSFNAVNALRLLARWMRMPCSTNQSSIAKAWQEFDGDGRMKESDFRDRLVDCAEEFAKFTAIMVPVADELTNRYSERKEKEKEGRLLTQAEKETKTMVAESRKG